MMEVSERLVESPSVVPTCDITDYDGDWPNIGTRQTYRNTQRTVLFGWVGLPIFAVQEKKHFRADLDHLLNPADVIQVEVLAVHNAGVGGGLTVTRGTVVANGCLLQTEGTVNRPVLLLGACVHEGAYRSCRIVELNQVVGSRGQNSDKMLASCLLSPSYKTYLPEYEVRMGQEGSALSSGWELA